MKYMGSKSRLASSLWPIIAKNLDKETYYVEPFAGGMNMMVRVNHQYRIANDMNNYLIAMWRFLIAGDLDFPREIDKETYVFWRRLFNKRGFQGIGDTAEEAMIGWIGFMGSFNGRFFDGGYSGHNVCGRDYIGEQIRNTLSQVELLRGVDFQCGSYKDVVYPDNSVIYCDPPYKFTTQYLISRDFNYDGFWQWCVDMTKKGHHVLVSEYNAPSDFKCIWEKKVTNALNTYRTHQPIERLFVHESLFDKY